MLIVGAGNRYPIVPLTSVAQRQVISELRHRLIRLVMITTYAITSWAKNTICSRGTRPQHVLHSLLEGNDIKSPRIKFIGIATLLYKIFNTTTSTSRLDNSFDNKHVVRLDHQLYLGLTKRSFYSFPGDIFEFICDWVCRIPRFNLKYFFRPSRQVTFTKDLLIATNTN